MVFPNRYINLPSSLLGQVALAINELKEQPYGIYCNNLSNRLGIKNKKLEYILVFLYIIDKIDIEFFNHDIKVKLK